jgi:GntR family transcriptional regulator
VLIRIDPRSPEPLFEQVVFAVKAAVAKGTAAPGDRLPSVRELARELAINPNTVVRAYEALERDGVVVRRQGAGCFVSDRGSDLALAEKRRQLRELVRRAVTEAFHLGFGADDVRKAFASCLDEVHFDGKRRQG